jgi:hypothetical protein
VHVPMTEVLFWVMQACRHAHTPAPSRKDRLRRVNEWLGEPGTAVRVWITLPLGNSDVAWLERLAVEDIVDPQATFSTEPPDPALADLLRAAVRKLLALEEAGDLEAVLALGYLMHNVPYRLAKPSTFEPRWFGWYPGGPGLLQGKLSSTIQAALAALGTTPVR